MVPHETWNPRARGPGASQGRAINAIVGFRMIDRRCVVLPRRAILSAEIARKTERASGRIFGFQNDQALEAIPLLASGKLDLAACQQLAAGNS